MHLILLISQRPRQEEGRAMVAASGEQACYWQELWDLVISVASEDDILKKTLPHDWRRFWHIRHRPAAGVSVTCHGVTLHIGIGELQVVDVEKGLLVGSGHENHSLLFPPGSLFLFFFHSHERLIRTVISFVEVYVFPCWTTLIGCSLSRDFNFLASPCVQDTISRTQVEDSAEGAPWWLLLNQSHIMSL